MNAQLFEFPPQGRSRHLDPITSKKAAARQTPERVWSKRERIVAELGFGPLTDDELCAKCEPNPRWWPSWKTARSALKKDGIVVATSLVRNGQTVWRRADRPQDRPVDTIGAL